MEAILIPIVGMMIPIIIVPTTLAFKHARFLREVQHKERMRAMELGVVLPERPSMLSSMVATAIGAGVPLGSMLIAFLADGTIPGDSESTWVAACGVGLGGVICGTILAYQQLAVRHQAVVEDHRGIKPEYDPDAFDVVSSRG